MTKILDIWPALPIVVEKFALPMSRADNIIPALEHNRDDRALETGRFLVVFGIFDSSVIPFALVVCAALRQPGSIHQISVPSHIQVSTSP